MPIAGDARCRECTGRSFGVQLEVSQLSWLVARLGASLCRSVAEDDFAKATVDVQISPEWIGGAFRRGSPETREIKTQGRGSGWISTDSFPDLLEMMCQGAANVDDSTFQISRSNDMQEP